MAAICNSHWQEVFNRKPFDGDAFERDASAYPRRLPSHPWEITLGHVDHVLCHLPTSLPGPIGIPFLAYKSLYIVTLLLFYDLLNDFVSENGHPVPTDFNEALLFLLPKNPSSTSAALGPAYTPSKHAPQLGR